MRADGSPEVGDGVDGTGDGRGKTDAVIGAEDVVIHRLGDGDGAEAFLVQPAGEGQRIVAADGDDRFQSERIQHPQDVLGAIDRSLVGVHPVFGADVFGHVGRFDVGWIGARGVQERSAGAVDGAHGFRRQGEGIFRNGFRIFGVDPQDAHPAAAQPDHLDIVLLGAGDHRPDGHIQPGNVAASR